VIWPGRWKAAFATSEKALPKQPIDMVRNIS